MKLLAKNKQEVKIQTENLDDLWYLSTILEEGDLIKGKTIRKIKKAEVDERSGKVVKKPVFLEIKAEKIDFSKSSDTLRVLGVITQGPEDIQRGDHHSFLIDESTTFTIIKENWLKYQLEKLKEACASKIGSIIMVVHDREEAYFALMKKYGYDLLSHIKGSVQKKGEDSGIVKNFYADIIHKLEEYDKKYNAEQIIIASPAFWKEELIKNMGGSELEKKMVIATCSSVGETAFNELLKRDEVKKALLKDRITKEMNLVEQLLAEIKKNDLAVYGLAEVENASMSGAIKDLLVTDKLIQRMKDEENYPRLEQIMKSCEQSKGKVTIISSEHEGGKKLDGLGGIGAILRYKLNYG